MTSIQHRVRHALTASIAAIGVVSALALTPAPAQAEIGPELTRFGEYGTGAGQLRFVGGGIAADPDSGHLFISEWFNNRISEFTSWGEFVKAWGWGVADGSPEAQTCGPPQPTSEPEASLCQAGTGGDKAGQLDRPTGIAVGPNGEVYVFERYNYRVQVFSQAGAFLRMFGGEVNKTSGADICTAADIAGGDECGAGIEGTGPSEFSISALGGTRRDYIDIAPDGTVYVGDQDRIQKFDEDGNYLSSLPLPEPGPVGALALDPESGDVYFSYARGLFPANSYRLDENSGAVIYPLPATAPEAIAPAPGGTVYLTDDPVPGANSTPEDNPHLLEIDGLGEEVESCCPSTSKDNEGIILPAATTNVVTAAGEADLYVVHGSFGQNVAFVEVRGTPPDKWPPPPVPPEINAQFASAVGSESAVLKAEIDPNFWSDTSYQLEYGTAPCSGGGCQVMPERQLGAGIVKKVVTSDGVVLSGLEPGTTYHYRFVTESSGGGPVFGPDTSFTTFALPKQVSTNCPNQALRTGPSAALADCRAYEMVSPVDKLGADISVFISSDEKPARLDQGSASGEKITYSASTAFGDAPSGPYSSQYLSTRGEGGWSTTGISPPRNSGSVLTVFDALDAQFKAFAEDLSSGWVLQDSDLSLAEGSVPGFANLYRRDNLGGPYEALTTTPPPTLKANLFVPELRGISADGKHAVFTVKDKLTPDAVASTAINQLYESFEGQLRLVSVKPNGSASTQDSTTGSYTGGIQDNRGDNVAGAVSDDGRLIYWSEKSGKLYVRVEGGETVAVSTGAGTFWTASPDGKGALFTEAGKLRRFDEQTRESTTLVASGVEGVMGASEDLSRIYFTSTSALVAGATAGQPNLYLHEDGEEPRFIATLPSQEVPGDNTAPKNRLAALKPLERLSRVTPDGATALFMTRGALTGAENLDRESGKAAAEVFRYDAETSKLTCLSCLPTGARPQAAELEITLGQSSGYLYAASIPGWEMQLHAPRALSEDGKRAYFNSLNRLVLTDTNGRQDVYQWEAEGAGECTDNAPGFNPAHEGCISLISDGKGPAEAEFIDASVNGQDVFFFTETKLLPQDVGQIDVYDARIEGGFPQPPAPAAECEGEACQSPISPPAEPSYASQGYQGPGNPKPAAKKAKKAKKKSGKQAKKKARQRKVRQQRNTGGRR